MAFVRSSRKSELPSANAVPGDSVDFLTVPKGRSSPFCGAIQVSCETCGSVVRFGGAIRRGRGFFSLRTWCSAQLGTQMGVDRKSEGLSELP